MSKRHQASRRRTYGRRQHELRERTDRSGEAGANELELAGDVRKPSGPFGPYGLPMARPGFVFLGLD